MLNVKRVQKKDLPEGSTHGFKIVDGAEDLMFFHWHESGEIELPSPDRLIEGQEKSIKQPNQVQQTTKYADVLEALPDRMEGMGYEKETDAVLAEVIGIFGVGN